MEKIISDVPVARCLKKYNLILTRVPPHNGTDVLITHLHVYVVHTDFWRAPVLLNRCLSANYVTTGGRAYRVSTRMDLGMCKTFEIGNRRVFRDKALIYHRGGHTRLANLMNSSKVHSVL